MRLPTHATPSLLQGNPARSSLRNEHKRWLQVERGDRRMKTAVLPAAQHALTATHSRCSSWSPCWRSRDRSVSTTHGSPAPEYHQRLGRRGWMPASEVPTYLPGVNSVTVDAGTGG